MLYFYLNHSNCFQIWAPFYHYMNQEKDVFSFAGWLLNYASCADFVSWSCPVGFMAHAGKPAQATQATWSSFAVLHCGTYLNPRRVHYEYFPRYLQRIAMAQWSKYWLALVTRLLQVGRAAVWMRNNPRGRKKKKLRLNNLLLSAKWEYQNSKPSLKMV